MYERFFSLKRTPFSLVPDPDCIYLTAQYADVISGLAFGVLERKGFVLLTAEAGMGKTTVLRALSELLAESNVTSSVVFTPTLTPPEFLESVMLNFGFKDIPGSKAQRLKLLEEFLVRSDGEGKVVALIVDEAHQLSAELLEEVRLLGNFESKANKFLQIVLVGQTELNDRLNLPHLWQLKQRITIRLSLGKLGPGTVAEYIRYRWSKAGGTEPIPFSAEALDAIGSWSNGIPRLINVIGDNALLMAFSDASHTVDVETVRAACQELSWPTPAIMGPPSHVVGTERYQHRAELASNEHRKSEPPSDPWVASRPGLLKRWLRLSDSMRPVVSDSATEIPSLHEP